MAYLHLLLIILFLSQLCDIFNQNNYSSEGMLPDNEF